MSKWIRHFYVSCTNKFDCCSGVTDQYKHMKNFKGADNIVKKFVGDICERNEV